MSQPEVIKSAVETVDKAVKQVEEGDVDSRDTPARYLAYGARLRPIVQPLSRYLAYTSDVGESFRYAPVRGRSFAERAS